MIKKTKRFCVSLLRGEPVAERMRVREGDMLRIQLQPVSILRRWNPQTVLLNLDEENNLQGKHTNTEIDTEAQGITCTDIDTISTNTLYKYKYLLTRWVMCSRNGSNIENSM